MTLHPLIRRAGLFAGTVLQRALQCIAVAVPTAAALVATSMVGYGLAFRVPYPKHWLTVLIIAGIVLFVFGLIAVFLILCRGVSGLLGRFLIGVGIAVVVCLFFAEHEVRVAAYNIPRLALGIVMKLFGVAGDFLAGTR